MSMDTRLLDAIRDIILEELILINARLDRIKSDLKAFEARLNDHGQKLDSILESGKLSLIH